VKHPLADASCPTAGVAGLRYPPRPAGRLDPGEGGVLISRSGFGQGAALIGEEGGKMRHRQYGMLVAVALVAGLIGGIGASWVLTSRLVFAESGSLPTKVLQAERFEVVDQVGKTRGALAVAANGALGLALADQAGKTRAILGMLSDGTPHLGFIDRKGRTRAILGTMPNGSMALALLDKKGRALWQAPSRSQQPGGPTVRRSAKEGTRFGKHHRQRKGG